MFIKNFHKIIEEIKAFLPEYLQSHGYNTTSTFRCINPKHEDNNPSMALIPSSNKTVAHCFSCGATYSIFQVCAYLEDKPISGRKWVDENLGYLANKYGIKIETKQLTDDDIYEMDTYQAYEAVLSLLTYRFNGEELQQPVKKEIQRRGWTTETLQRYSVGSIFDFDEFINQLSKMGFARSFLREIDLCRRDIFNHENIIFTWKDERGRPVGFTGRNVLFNKKDKKNKPKYKNTRNNTTNFRCGIFKKNSRLYGIDSVPPHTSSLYIFEGQSDVITAKQNGLLNSCCSGGSIISEDQIHLIKKLGIYKIFICNDADDAGKKKTEQILVERLAGHRDIDVKVILLPEGEDPDSFIRNNGIDTFTNLPTYSGFEYQLSKYEEEEDNKKICKEIIPIIANDPSAITRETYIRKLSNRTDFPIEVLREEVNSIIDVRKNEAIRERNSLIDKVAYELKSNPTNAEEILQTAQSDFTELAVKHNKISFSSDDFITALITQKEKEENKTNDYEGFILGEDLKSLENTLCGDWTKDVVMYCGGSNNTGKSAYMCKIIYEILNHNKDTTAIYHTIDDTRELSIPRFVCIAEGSKTLPMASVRHPNYWASLPHNSSSDLFEKRQRGYDKVIGLAREGRLIIKDVNNGKSLPYIEGLISYHRDKTDKLIYVIDNFHKLDWFGDKKDERIRWKKTSEKMKELAEKYHCCILGTVEYHKMPRGTKPSNYNVGETNQISYDANFLLHLYNEIADVPDRFSVCHMATNGNGEMVPMPRVECIVGKNKISDKKDTFFIDFYPFCSDFSYIDINTVNMEREQRQQDKSGENKLNNLFGR